MKKLAHLGDATIYEPSGDHRQREHHPHRILKQSAHNATNKYSGNLATTDLLHIYLSYPLA